MKSIRQSCPSCGRSLELPADAIGRRGQCPACDFVFTIAAPAAIAHPYGSPQDSGRDDEEEIKEAEIVSEGDERSSDATGTALDPPAASGGSEGEFDPDNPFSTPLPSGTTEPLPTAMHVPIMQRVNRIEAPPVARGSIDSILPPALTIFGERWPVIVFAAMIVVSTIGFLTLIPGLVVKNIADAGGQTAAGVLAMIWIPLLVTVACAATVGLLRVALSVARDDKPSAMSELVAPLSLSIRFFVGLLMVMLVAGMIDFAILAVAAGLSNAAANPQVGAFLGVTGICLMVTFGLFFQWLLWAWPFIVSDGRGTAFGSIRLAMSLTLANKMTSAILVLISIVLMAVGTVTCMVGHLLTAPLIVLLFAVAYLTLTGQPIDVEGSRRAQPQGPAPGSEPASEMTGGA